MENVSLKFANSKTELEQAIEELITLHYPNTNTSVKRNSIAALRSYLLHFIDALYFVVEHPYVDKLYRDTYYHYYSSKLKEYSRDSIKVSIFTAPVQNDDFRSLDKLTEIKTTYSGFFTIRPTFPKIIGRSVILPGIIVHKNLVCCQAPVPSTVNSVKLIAHGFPHSSQDAETISCAETTIWSIIEYFSHKYPEYRPILPHQITELINKLAHERLIPSKGLTAAQISFALKELGFGVRIYSRKSFHADFDILLKTYIESGIPVIATMHNKQGIGHAVNIIGRELPDEDDFNNLHVSVTLANNVNVCEFVNMPLQYVVIDDNFPPYQLTQLDTPSAYYADKLWEGCVIESFIVPLYPKIYLEAADARHITRNVIERFGTIKDQEIILRTFLCSSRSFKNSLAMDEEMDSDSKELLLNISLPKFIWVTEISDRILIKQNRCNGLIIVDATEPKVQNIIAYLHTETYIYQHKGSFVKINVNSQPFKLYTQNLII